jgi:hypothetical protein
LNDANLGWRAYGGTRLEILFDVYDVPTDFCSASIERVPNKHIGDYFIWMWPSRIDDS